MSPVVRFLRSKIVVGVIWLLIAMAIKLDSPGPVLFIQDRTGFGGQTFRLFKFRTMRALSADPCDSVSKSRQRCPDSGSSLNGSWPSASICCSA